MNMYFVDAGEQHFSDKVSMEFSYHYTEQEAFVIAAETPGKARAELIRASFARIEWNSKISVRLIAKNIDAPAGVIDDYDLIERYRDVFVAKGIWEAEVK